MTDMMTIDTAAIATTVVEMARDGRFAEMEQLFAPVLRAAVSAETVRDAWGAEINRRGPVSTIGEPASSVAFALTTVVVAGSTLTWTNVPGTPPVNGAR